MQTSDNILRFFQRVIGKVQVALWQPPGRPKEFSEILKEEIIHGCVAKSLQLLDTSNADDSKWTCLENRKPMVSILGEVITRLLNKPLDARNLTRGGLESFVIFVWVGVTRVCVQTFDPSICLR